MEVNCDLTGWSRHATAGWCLKIFFLLIKMSLSELCWYNNILLTTSFDLIWFDLIWFDLIWFDLTFGKYKLLEEWLIKARASYSFQKIISKHSQPEIHYHPPLIITAITDSNVNSSALSCPCIWVAASNIWKADGANPVSSGCKYPRPRCWTQSCSWWAGQHLAWQLWPSVYIHFVALLWSYHVFFLFFFYVVLMFVLKK